MEPLKSISLENVSKSLGMLLGLSVTELTIEFKLITR